MRLIIFVALLLTCFVLTEARSFRSSQAKESLEKHPHLIKEKGLVDIAENHSFSVLPPRQTQEAGPYTKPAQPLFGNALDGFWRWVYHMH